MFARTLTLVLAALLLTAGAAFGKGFSGHFGDMDTDGDGLVTYEEFQAYFPHGDQETYNIIAGDQGSIDHDAWHKFKEAHGYGHGEGKGMGDGHGENKGHGHSE